MPTFRIKYHALSSKSFIYQQMNFVSVLENIKIYSKYYIKISILI